MSLKRLLTEYSSFSEVIRGGKPAVKNEIHIRWLGRYHTLHMNFLPRHMLSHMGLTPPKK